MVYRTGDENCVSHTSRSASQALVVGNIVLYDSHTGGALRPGRFAGTGGARLDPYGKGGQPSCSGSTWGEH